MSLNYLILEHKILSSRKTKPYTTKSITEITACNRSGFFFVFILHSILFPTPSLLLLRCCLHLIELQLLDWWGAIDINSYKVFYHKLTIFRWDKLLCDDNFGRFLDIIYIYITRVNCKTCFFIWKKTETVWIRTWHGIIGNFPSLSLVFSFCPLSEECLPNETPGSLASQREFSGTCKHDFRTSFVWIWCLHYLFPPDSSIDWWVSIRESIEKFLFLLTLLFDKFQSFLSVNSFQVILKIGKCVFGEFWTS